MKKLAVISFLFVAGFSFGQDMTNGGTYMNYFSSDYEVIQKDMWDYTKSVSHGRSARKVEKKRAELVKSTSAGLSKAKRAKDYNYIGFWAIRR